MKTHPFSSEAEMAGLIVGQLRAEGWTVYQEVACRGRVADIVAERRGQLWVIETKLLFGLQVVEQARWWCDRAHVVSVGTPWARGNPVLVEYLRSRGMGWIQVGAETAPWERLPAQNRPPTLPGLAEALRPEQLVGVGAGAAGGGHYTEFKATCARLRATVERQPGVPLADALAGIDTHYRSKASARANLTRWIDLGKVPGVRLEREAGQLRLYPVLRLVEGGGE